MKVLMTYCHPGCTSDERINILKNIVKKIDKSICFSLQCYTEDIVLDLQNVDLILSDDCSYCPNFWDQIGQFEKDGGLVVFLGFGTPCPIEEWSKRWEKNIFRMIKIIKKIQR